MKRFARWLLALASTFFLGACMGTAAPPLDQATAAALAQHPMRRLETRSLEIYYPEARRELALRVAARLEYCATELKRRAKLHNGYADRKLVLLMPEAPINNAWVMPPFVSTGPFAVVPTYSTLDAFGELELPFDPGRVGCHEAVHYVQALQVAGAWRWINTILGDVLTPQLGFDPWFWEGLATYYESALAPNSGRMQSPGWRGFFHAAFAGGGVSGGDLDAWQRPFHWGNQYLVGSHFIEFLLKRYGEGQLWRVVAKQGRSLLFPYFISNEFRSVYGKSLGRLLDEFASYVAENFPPRARPAEQRWVRGAGEDAHYAVALDGSEAVITASGDDPIVLRIYDRSGALVREQPLTHVLPFGALGRPRVQMTSGLSFTADGRAVYFVALDTGSVQLEARLVRYDVQEGALEVVASDLGGSGGGVSPDGRVYYYSRAAGDRADLAVFDLAGGGSRTLSRAPPGTYYLSPRPAPNGKRLAVTVAGVNGSRVEIFSANGGAALARLAPSSGNVLDPWFFDDARVVLLGRHEGRYQAYLVDIESTHAVRVTDAPYLALSPRPHAGSLRFLNREGTAWSVEEVPLQARALVERFGSDGPKSARVEPPPPADVLGDEPYSSLDHLFVPNLRAFAALNPEGDASLFGLSLSGSDRLQFHRWALTGLVHPDSGRVSGLAEYVNRQLAPLTISLAASQRSWEYEDADGVELPRRVRDARLSVGRAFGRGSVAIGAKGTEDRRHEADVELFPDGTLFFVPRPLTRRLAGPFLSLRYSGEETTPYAGVRRGLFAGASATAYPEAFSTLETFTDLRAYTYLVAPLPLSRRHTLELGLRARGLAELTQGTGLLEVGGQGSLASLFVDSNQPSLPDFDAPALPPDISFVEPLRGFEDYSLALERVGIAELTYRYPIIIDRGATSFLLLFPSWFLRQLDFELFASGAADYARRDRTHTAAGGSLTLSTRFFLAPLDLRYQVARRFTDDEALVQSLWLAVDIEAQRYE